MYDSCKGSNNMICSYHELKRFIVRDYILSRDLLNQFKVVLIHVQNPSLSPLSNDQ